LVLRVYIVQTLSGVAKQTKRKWPEQRRI